MSDENLKQSAEMNAVLQQVAGQLKGALGSIHGALEKLAPPDERESDRELDRNAAVLLQSCYRIQRLAGNLELAAMLDTPGTVRPTNCDIVDFCRELVDKSAHSAKILGLELVFVCEKSNHVVAMDREKMERLMLNLLSNAFKFTPAGGKITVELRVGQTVELRVSDTGKGISPDKLENVFERCLLPDRLDPPPHGLGLGLPICRKIARDHGGSILLESREGEGTTVVVSLPNKRSVTQRLNTFKVDYAGGFDPVLLELADALPLQAFTHAYLD